MDPASSASSARVRALGLAETLANPAASRQNSFGVAGVQYICFMLYNMSRMNMPRPETFAALADPTRLAIVERLLDGEATVTDLARPFALSQPAISRHLKVLEEAGLIETRVAGTARPRRLRPEAVDALWGWLDRLRRTMEANYARLDTVLDDLQTDPGKD
jgi:DNA-binding transcriptional ArsR family regulator